MRPFFASGEKRLRCCNHSIGEGRAVDSMSRLPDTTIRIASVCCASLPRVPFKWQWLSFVYLGILETSYSSPSIKLIFVSVLISHGVSPFVCWRGDLHRRSAKNYGDQAIVQQARTDEEPALLKLVRQFCA